jgi:hypothetical protein
MNLYDLCDSIKSGHDYDPEDRDYDAQIRRQINEKYLWLFGLRKWSFAYKQTTITVRPDYTTGTVTLNQGSRTATGAGTSWVANMEGAHLITSDGTSYEIGRVASSTTLYLVTPYTGSSGAGLSYTIRWQQYALPLDCVDYDGITARTNNRGVLRYMDRDSEESLGLDFTATGEPSVYFPVTSPVRKAPDKRLSAALVAGGALTAGTTYVYKYRYKMAGTSSGPCARPDAEGTPSGGNLTIRLTNFLECAATDPRKAEIFRAERSDLRGAVGPFYRIYVGQISGGTFDDDGGSDKIPDTDFPWEDDPTRWYIQFWPRTEATEALEVRYRFRPPHLQKDSDEPLLPLESHTILKELVLAEILSKHTDARAAIYARSANTSIADMTSRYLLHQANKRQRGPWYGEGAGVGYNFGPLTHTGG